MATIRNIGLVAQLVRALLFGALRPAGSQGEGSGGHQDETGHGRFLS
mgnify:CR=1 FL=1